MPTGIASAAVAGVIAGSGFSVATLGFSVGFSLNVFATSLAISTVGKVLTPKAKQPSLAFDSAKQSIKQPIMPWRVVYGTDRIGGAITFDYHDPGGVVAGLLFTFTCHRVRGFRDIYFGDELVERAADGWNVKGRLQGSVGLETAIGTESGQPLPNLANHSLGKWTAKHRQNNFSKMYFRYVLGLQLFNGNLPNISVIFDGYDYIYDPRDTTYKFTTNPALIVADYLTNARFNERAVTYSEIDEDALIAAANICDERVSQVFQPEFTVNTSTDVITFTADQSQINTGDAVKYVTTGTDATGITSGSLYYFIKTDTDEGKLATTRANALAEIAIDLTGAGTGTQTLERMPVVTADPDTDELTFEYVDNRLQLGDGVQVETDDTLPAGISAATTYYLIQTSNGKVQLATTYANALAGTAIDITDSGTGVHRLKPIDEVRYATNGSFTLDQNPKDIIAQLVKPMAGSAVKIGGVWHINAGAYTAPSIELNDTEMAGPRQVKIMPDLNESANGVRGVFVGPENRYQPTDFIPATNSSYVTKDNGETYWKEFEVSMVRRHSLMRRLAKIELETTRQALTVTLQCKISAYRCQPDDIIAVTVSRYGWSSKAFRVINSKLVLRGSGTKESPHYLGVDLILRETASGIYDWTATENSTVDTSPNTTLADPFQVARQFPPIVSGLQISGQDLDTEFTGRDCKLEWRRSSITGFRELGQETDLGAGAGVVDSFIDGYQVRVYKTDGTLLREEPLIKDTSYVYTLEKNFEDTEGVPERSFIPKVWAHTKYGLESLIPAQLTVSNPVPTTDNVSATATPDGFKLQYDRPADTDWERIEICASTSMGFTPDTAAGGNLVYTGADIPAVVRGLASGTLYYYQYRLRDSFGPGDWSGELSVTTQKSVNRNSNTPSSSNYDLSLTGASSVGHTVLAAVEIDGYPPNPPAQLSAAFAGQFTCGGTGEIAEFQWRCMLVSSKPSSTGTVAIAFVSGTSYSLTGTGTDFTVLAANDWIYLGEGKPLFRIFSVTDATNATLRLVTGGPSAGSYSASGLSFTAYRGDTVTVSPGTARNLAANAVQDVSINAGAKLTGTGYSSIFLTLNGGVTSGNSITATRCALQAQWVQGA